MAAGLRASALFIFLFALAGCHRTHEKQIAVIPKANSSVFWISVHAGAEAAGEKFHVSVLWDGPPQETDYSRQVEILDSMIARHVDGIAVAAAERDALNHSIDRAKEQNIPLLVFDSGVTSQNYMTFIATDNFGAGQMAAREMGELLRGKGTVAEIMHAPGSQSTGERERGFEDVIARQFPKIHIVAKNYSMSDRAKAMSVTEDILTANPGLDGLFASSEPSSVGAAQALKARRLTGKIRLVAFDSTKGLVDDLRAGVIDALVAQDPFRIGFEAVQTLALKLSGGQPQKQVSLPATVITRADLGKPEIQSLLNPDLKRHLK